MDFLGADTPKRSCSNLGPTLEKAPTSRLQIMSEKYAARGEWRGLSCLQVLDMLHTCGGQAPHEQRSAP